ncbi:hypothetical protein [Pseudoroseicyclus aestuarii]|uniref:hypothetical protein n=1 Tax=Pseudoroseicyclus aestuarii TaxID=1795041 RepID=UPI0011B51DF1|nr:hypothetical protein [Pseudoroseicyclus aestuarii]
MYKRLAVERGELVNTSDDDTSLASLCLVLQEKLKVVQPGAEHAHIYHELVQAIITAVFYPQLAIPRSEWPIHGGRKRIDIVYMNDSREGFLSQRRDEPTSATMLIVECKNYTKDICNAEFDQLLGRFDNNRGKFGWMLCRRNEDAARALQRCRDAASSQRGYILVITDEDLVSWLEAKAKGQDRLIELALMEKYRDIIS